jgi:hypothetical protein
MAGVPPKRGEIFYWEIELTSQANTNIFQVNPTLVAGDVIVYKDGVLDGNIDILPTAIGAGATLACQLSAEELTPDRVRVCFHDVAGAEWQDQTREFHTVTTPSDELVDAIWDEVLTGVTHNGTAVAATTQTITLDNDASADDRIYVPNLIVITNGTGAGQTRMILEYSSEKVAVVDRPWTTIPVAADSEYQLIGFNSILLASHGIATSGTADTITVPGIAPVDVGCVIFIAGGTGIGEVPGWTTIPDATTIYKVLPVGLSVVATLSANALAQVNAEADTALTDYDAPTNAEMQARTLVAANYATAANQTTILSRIGAFTGTGVNTILGFLKALMSKAASTPSDVGGTFSATSDSAEAIRDVLSTASVTVADVVDADEITIRRYATWDISITSVTTVTDTRTKLYFTVKANWDDEDSASIVQIEETAGLLYFDRAAASNASQGSLVFSGTTATIVVDKALTGLRKQSGLRWDLKEVDVDGKAHVRAEGTFNIGEVVTKATS